MTTGRVESERGSPVRRPRSKFVGAPNKNRPAFAARALCSCRPTKKLQNRKLTLHWLAVRSLCLKWELELLIDQDDTTTRYRTTSNAFCPWISTVPDFLQGCDKNPPKNRPSKFYSTHCTANWQDVSSFKPSLSTASKLICFRRDCTDERWMRSDGRRQARDASQLTLTSAHSSDSFFPLL